MSAFSFFKKKTDGLVPPPPPMAPISKLDAKIPPLPSLPSLPPLKPAAPVAPPVPAPQPVAAPRPVPAPVQVPKPAPAAPPAMSQPKPMPAPALPPLFKDKQIGDVPPISVPRTEPPKPVVAPAPVAAPPVPAPAPQPLKLENSKLAKALEELSALDLDIPQVQAPEKVKPAPTAMSTPARGSNFVPIDHFDDALVEIHTMQEHLQGLQAKNEKLGMIETKTKEFLDALIQHHDYMQKHLLAVDEKLFKVN